MTSDSENREFIRDLVARYNIAGDSRDLEAFVAVFSPDAIYESAVFKCEGRDAIKAYLQQAWAVDPGRPRPRTRRHHLTTAQIDLIDAVNAEGTICYLVVTEAGSDHGGFYRDRYRCGPDGWKIAYRAVWMDWAREDSLLVPDASKRIAAAGKPAGPPPHGQ